MILDFWRLTAEEIYIAGVVIVAFLSLITGLVWWWFV